MVRALFRLLPLLVFNPAMLHAGQVIFTEVMYHPPGARPEFIEVTNLTSNRLDMARWALSGGVEYTFPDYSSTASSAHLLKEYERIILSSADEATTRAAWPAIPAGVRVFGPWTGALNNSGEDITLRDAAHALQCTLTYGDNGDWPVAADGAGHSLQIINQNREVDDWRNWRASRFAGGSPGTVEPPLTEERVLALSEAGFAPSTGRTEWVEIHNTGTAAKDLTGWFVSSVPDLSDSVALTGTLAAGGYTSVAADFASSGGELVLYLHDGSNHVAATAELRFQAERPSVQAWPAGAGEWYTTPESTRDAANNPQRQSAVVINEILYRLPSKHDEGEFIELYNQSAETVSLAGWAFTDGIDFTFPAGTTIGAGQYLVLAKSPDYIAANYPGLGAVTVLGPYAGTMRSAGEELRLEDASGNLADTVDYKQGGQWPVAPGGDGSSLELMHPAMDNSQPSSWRASDESGKSAFQSFTHTGTYRELRGQSPGASTTRELLVNMVGDGHVILKNIRLTKATAPAVNMIATGDATSHNGNGATGFLCTGTHCESDTLPRTGATITGEPGFHLISRGGGDTKANKAEVDLTGLQPNDLLTLTFDGRWVSGLPLMVAQTWDRSFGKVFRFPVPGNLGTPGAANSCLRPAPAPTVDHMSHFPVVPTATQNVVLSARISSATALGGVSAQWRADSSSATGTWNTVAMNDSGTSGDARAGDGIWSASVPVRPNGSITQFYIRAAAENGQENECPRDGAKRPGLWIVANTAPPAQPGLLIQRTILSQYHRNALNAGTGYSAAYDWDHPRMSNYGFNSTFIFNESDVLYNCEVRRGGSPWTRTDSNVLDRTRWKPPGDQLFRGRSKAGVDNDASGASRFHNRMVRYMLYLFGYPVPDSEFIVQVVNADSPRLGDEMEQTDSDFFDRAYDNGSEGELFEIDDSWFMYDSNGMNDRLDAGSVTGRWSLRDWNGSTAALPSEESPIFFHGNWPVRFPEARYDYAALSAMIKIAANNNAGVSAAQDAGYREKMERVLDIDRAAVYAAVRGYAGDWDNFTINRGKNGYFYRRPGDGRFEFHHWDSDLAFQNTSEAFLGSAGGIGWTNLSNRPWFRQKFNYYLSQIVTRYTTGTTRLSAWLTAMNYQSSVSHSLAPFKTSNYNYAGSWFTSRNNASISQITTANYNRSFTCTTTDNQTVTTPVFGLAGAAPSRVQSVEVAGHPEAVFAWVPTTLSNTGLWSLSNLRLANGVNTLSIRALLGDGSVLSTLPLTVTFSGNGPPVALLETVPALNGVAVGETMTLDARGSFDPEQLALGFTWSVVPSAGALLTQPEFGLATARFSVPGNYVLTLQVMDAQSQTVTLTRNITVWNGKDFAGFEEGVPASGYTFTNVESRGNFPAGAWYSVEDFSGQLLVQVPEDAALPLEPAGFMHPWITRDLPDTQDFVLQTELRPDTREFGNWSAGLLLEVTEDGAPVRYAFGLEGGVNLLVQRSAPPAAYSTLSTTAVTGSGAGLRVVRSGTSLLFQQRGADGWTTLFTRTLPAGTVAGQGGLFVATSLPTSVRMAFDYLLVADPSATNSVLNNLRITEVHYRPASGGVEFIELRNTGTEAISLEGVSFGEGNPFSMAGGTPLPYVFGTVTLQAGEFLVLTENSALFRSLYGNGPRLGPDWTSGSLSNSGEDIVLLDPLGNVIHDFSYGVTAPWPVQANGGGSSLEVIDVQGDYALASNWRASAVAGGTPGAAAASPAADTDGDGVPDSVEALFGTNAASAGSLPVAALAPAAGGGGGLTLSWPSVAGVVYTVWASADLTDWEEVQTLTGQGTWTFTPVAGQDRNYYRVSAAPAP